MKPIVIVAGTRPEIIKMFPVWRALKQRGAPTHFCYSGQHVELALPFLKFFGLAPDSTLNIMKPGQSLAALTAGAVQEFGRFLESNRDSFGAVLVQGDTTTAFAAALASFYARVPVGHVEAGLRTSDIAEPFPEELNRRLITRIADWHYAPTARARETLLAEHVPADQVVLTGNTGVDALLWTLNKAAPPQDAKLRALESARRLVLVTTHRRENIGEPLKRIVTALATLAGAFPDVSFVLPVHRNPSVAETVRTGLTGLANVHLTEPLEYTDFVWAFSRAELVLSDSGGVQEEAPTLRKPVLVLRNETERPEAVEFGTSIMVGSDRDRIVNVAREFLNGRRSLETESSANPFGDGTAAPRIAEHLLASLRS